MVSIQVDRAGLTSAVQAYLRSRAGHAALKEFALPSWVLVGVGVFQIVMGLLLMLTLIKFPSGIKNLYEGVTLKALRDQQRLSPEKMAQLKPMIGHLLYGHPSTGLALVLGSLADEPNETSLAAVAQHCATLYKQDTTEPAKQAMFRMLKDDAYQAYRRRPLVPPFQIDPQAYLFDAHVNFSEGCPTPWRSMLYAFVVSESEIAPIPWSVVHPHVKIQSE